ncbi:hypothetical protein D7F60_10840 [Salmonella enterica]|uniref:hypothetical protein n=1 Tax=Salmonella enterica TaxID=28901 RepID=UPI000A192AC2|nr:hypothetical protein [Salmonella enterica]EAN1102036.1 hypothetical protein [Salmonella enterica subsp. enterica serovar Hadar]EEG5047306.1 hypothetical protein [Salmonella enterica subsp. enterica]EAA9739157.1 hypothetical protein [Salmonella enterica subsp. enterica serovar Holcomb]EAC1656959.1 hypothetical protein [Salmonella enterica subsp. enterica serovar Holcomb]EAP1593283.1 hypothetical protein [Salmonella enterica]
MKLYEMELFLRGKCIPGDLKVNETNAEYLVRKFSEAEAKISALAAENSGLKGGIKQAFEDMEAHHDDDGLFSYDADGEPMDALLRLCDAQGSITSLMNYETPDTDVFLAEVRASAQSEVIEWLDAEITAIDTMYRGDPSYKYDAYWMKSNVLDVVELARKAFVVQLRKGAAQ